MTEYVVGPEVIGSYPNLFKPTLRKDANPDDKPKFSITSLLTHAAIQTPEYRSLVALVNECGVAKWGRVKYEEMVREGVVKSPFHKDIASKGYDPERFAVRIQSSANEEYPPRKLKHGPDGKLVEITDPREFYPGVKLRISYSARAYGGPGTKWTAGISLDLHNVLKVGDGERLTTAGPTGDEFGGIAPPAAEPIDMAALLG